MEAMSLELNSKIVERHEKKYKEMEEQLKSTLENLKRDIKKETAEKDAEFYTLVVSNLNFSGNKAENIRLRQQLIRDLQSEPNFISRTETEIDGHKLAAKMQPYAFKWVEKSVKMSMRFRANVVKGLSESQIAFLEQRMKHYERGTETDISRCFEYLVRIGADKTWVPLDIFEVTRKCSVPIEACTKAIDALVKNNAVVLAKYKMERGNRHGTSTEKVKLAVSIGYTDNDIERLMADAEDSDYVTKKIEANQGNRKKANVSAKKISKLVEDINIEVDTDKRKEVLTKVHENMMDMNTTNSVKLVGRVEDNLEQNKPEVVKLDNVKSSTEHIDNFQEFATMLTGEVANKVASFFEGQANNLQEERDQALFEKNNAVIFKEKQATYINALQEKIDKLEDKLARTQNKLSKTEERLKAYENFAEDFSVNAINQFRVMKRLIMKAAFQFSELPKYQKWDEGKKADFSEAVDEALRNTSERIVNFTPTSKLPPNQK